MSDADRGPARRQLTLDPVPGVLARDTDIDPNGEGVTRKEKHPIGPLQQAL
jgi:hypothetical protein